jgi:t-SNARE complex subunit (syntaxin)
MPPFAYGATLPARREHCKEKEAKPMDNYEQIYNAYKNQGEQQMMQEMMVQNVAAGSEQIVAVRKNNDGDIIAVKTNTGRELDYVTALNEAKAGTLAHVDVFHRYGRDILRSEPDGIKQNNLDNLPPF